MEMAGSNAPSARFDGIRIDGDEIPRVMVHARRLGFMYSDTETHCEFTVAAPSS